MIMGGDPVQLNGLGGNERRSNSGSQVVMRGPGGITGLGGKNDIRMLKVFVHAEEKTRYYFTNST